jgi:hypothetical protein
MMVDELQLWSIDDGIFSFMPAEGDEDAGKVCVVDL